MKDLKNYKSIHVLIAFGILFVITCAVITILNPISKPVNVLNITFLFLQAFIGLSLVIFSRKISKMFFHLFVGLLFLSWSIFSLFTELIFPFTIKEDWPLFGVITGILWFVAGRIKYGRMKFGFVIPSVTLFGMGLWYSLFSFNVIKLSFKSIACSLGPIFMVAIAVFLVLLFLAQQKHKELVFSDEETGVFSDEESLFRPELEDED